MTFQDNFDQLMFNLETFNLLKELNEPLDELDTLGFTSDIQNVFTSNSETVINSLMLRLKLYAKMNKDLSFVVKSLEKYSFFTPIINYLFNVETTQKAESVKSVKAESVKSVKVESVEEESVEEKSFYDRFFDKYIKESEDDSVKTSEAYQIFTEWFENTEKGDLPDKKELKKYLTSKLGKSGKGVWKGYQIVHNLEC